VTCPHCAALQRDLDEAMRLLNWVLAELQSMEAGADSKFQRLLKKLVRENQQKEKLS
jgi:hypothetical protein